MATQKPELRAKFEGKPEHVMAYLLFVAQDVREHLAAMGYRSAGRGDRPVGPAGATRQFPVKARVAGGREVAARPRPDLAARAGPSRRSPAAASGGDAARRRATLLNEQIVNDARAALDEGWKVKLHYTIRNQDRSVGARLAGEITAKYHETGLPPGTIEIDFRGYAGQSFGAFTANGMRLHLVGAANDYVGKGMRGGEISIRPFPEATYDWADNHILGNTALYGATGGALFAAGRAGERFAVRNSGACGVVEGVGDNALEYMTGGVVVVLGPTGRNFAAGMTGGMAFVYDPDGTFVNHCNRELVDVDRLTHPGMKKLVRVAAAAALRADQQPAGARSVEELGGGVAVVPPHHPQGPRGRDRDRSTSSATSRRREPVSGGSNSATVLVLSPVDTVLVSLGCGVVGYLIGSIPFGWVIVKLVKGIDIRQYGSGRRGEQRLSRPGFPCRVCDRHAGLRQRRRPGPGVEATAAVFKRLARSPGGDRRRAGP